MRSWSRLLTGLLLAALALPALAERVLFIATPNVPAGKFRALSEIGARHGITVEHRYLQTIPADADASLWTGYDAVFIDSYLQEQVRAKLVRALPGLRVPHAWLYDQQPAWGAFPEALGKRLITHYSNGGAGNFDAFFARLAAHLRGSEVGNVPEPLIFPKAAIYHPDAPGQVFPDAAAYFRWKQIDARKRSDKPVIAIAFHQQYLASIQTGLIDSFVRTIEARGGIALAFYAPAMRGEGFAPLLKANGEALCDVLINTQIVLDGEARRADFASIGRPVLQALSYRSGSEQDWRADPTGVPMNDVPFYLAQPEYAGAIDAQMIAATRKEDEAVLPISGQFETVVDKAFRIARLRHATPGQKRLALMFWNYPPGEKNLSASFLDVPESLRATFAALKAEGYALADLPKDEAALIERLQRLLAPYYREVDLAALVASGDAAELPMSDYRRWYEALPESVRTPIEARFGEPEQSLLVLDREGDARFVIPRLKLGSLVVLPQPPRGERWESAEKAIYHSTTSPPSHQYLATYLWLRQGHRSDALIHFGTHGSQEWLPGKERGLSIHDAPMLALGDLPVIYPYIADNIGEALQARRRGRALIVSHQTPPFRPAGLHTVLVDLHDLLHQWLNQGEGAVREQIARQLLDGVEREHVLADLGYTRARAEQELPAFVDQLHAHLHELAQTAQPLGLHALGRAPASEHRLATVLLMLGKPFWEAAAKHAGVAEDQRDETLAGDYETLRTSVPFRLLETQLAKPTNDAGLPDELKKALDQARAAHAAIDARNELPALLSALRGDYLPTSYGGDPIRNPDAYPTGRNLYGFDPSRIPTQAAWAASEQAANDLIEAHRRDRGQVPSKLTFSLWSVETMRHQGLLEAQALRLLGVEPEWDAGGRVTGVRLIPRERLNRPRVDVVLSATGLYRDHFPNLMQHLVKAVELAAQADEADNPVKANSERIASSLMQRGLDRDAALAASRTRLFSSASGAYGTGLDDATLASDSWKGKAEGDAKLAELYLARMQYAYGPDTATWGRSDLAGAKVNLYAEQLRGTEGAVLSRSSNLYGMLTTDDPFQYLGGIGLAVRHLDGKAPNLMISNLRGGGSGRAEGAAGFLAKELSTRYFHPGYIKGLMAEGYAGTLQVTDTMNNFWGWTATSREIVRDDQWQSFVDVYVRDKHQLGLREWFERENPAALAQTIERMLEAARQDYWKADAATLDELKRRYVDLMQRFDLQTNNAALAEFVGYGLQAAAQPARPDAPAKPVEGQRLERVEPEATSVAPPWQSLLAWSILLALVVIGAASRARSRPPTTPIRTARLHAASSRAKRWAGRRLHRLRRIPVSRSKGVSHG